MEIVITKNLSQEGFQLDVPTEIYDKLRSLSDCTGRPVSEIAVIVLKKALERVKVI